MEMKYAMSNTAERVAQRVEPLLKALEPVDSVAGWCVLAPTPQVRLMRSRISISTFSANPRSSRKLSGDACLKAFQEFLMLTLAMSRRAGTTRGPRSRTEYTSKDPHRACHTTRCTGLHKSSTRSLPTEQ